MESSEPGQSYLEPLVLVLAILIGFIGATIIFNLLATGMFVFFAVIFLMSILSVAFFFGSRHRFSLHLRIYLTIAAMITLIYGSYALIVPSYSLTGLSVGKWVRYGDFGSFGSQTILEPAQKIEWLKADVVKVLENSVVFHVSGLFKNSTTIEEFGVVVDVLSGSDNVSSLAPEYWHVFRVTAANLKQGDYEYPNGDHSASARTVRTQVRDYLGVARNVNIVDQTSDDSFIEVFDQVSGVLLERNVTDPSTGRAPFRILETNIFPVTSVEWLRGNMMFLVVVIVDTPALIALASSFQRRKRMGSVRLPLRERLREILFDEDKIKIGLRYLAHGLLYQLLTTVLLIVGVFTTAALVILGNIIGLIIGIALLIVAIGLINSVVAEYIWDFSIEISFTQLLFHGIVMSISLLFVNGLLVVLPQFLFPGVLTTLVTFFPAAILDGMAGRYVAEHFSN